MTYTLPSVLRTMMIFSCGTSFSRAQRTRCMREDTSKPNWNSLMTIPTTLHQWLSKPKCGTQIFTLTEKCAFRSFTLQGLTPWMPKNRPRKDGDQFWESRQFWSVSFLWWMIQISSHQRILMPPCSSEMTLKGTRNKLENSPPDHLRTCELASSETKNLWAKKSWGWLVQYCLQITY